MSWAQILLLLCNWANSTISLYLSFLTCQMGMRIVVTTPHRVKLDNTQCLVLSKYKVSGVIIIIIASFSLSPPPYLLLPLSLLLWKEHLQPFRGKKEKEQAATCLLSLKSVECKKTRTFEVKLSVKKQGRENRRCRFQSWLQKKNYLNDLEQVRALLQDGFLLC